MPENTRNVLIGEDKGEMLSEHAKAAGMLEVNDTLMQQYVMNHEITED